MSLLLDEFAVGIHLIKLNGPLNINQAEAVIQQFRDMSEQGVKRVLIDLEDVCLIDSRGLAALVAGYKIFGSEAQNFQLVGLQDQPQLVFELTGFDRIFQICDSVDEVVAAELNIKVQLPQGSMVLMQPLAIPNLAA